MGDEKLSFNNQSIETRLIPERLMFTKGDYRIYSCTTNDPNLEVNKYNNVSITGTIQRLDLGVEYIATIEESKRSAQYGLSYNCISIYQDTPVTSEDQKSFLKYLLTETQVKEIFNYYPDQNVIDLIKDNNFDYKNIKGIGEATFLKIRQKVLDNIEHKELLSKLGKYGITYNVVMKLAEQYESSALAIQKIEDNPYVLTTVSGVGFIKADLIARKMGFGLENPFRIQAGVRYTVEKNQLDGHTFIYIDKLIKNAIEILQLKESLIEGQITKAEGIIIIEDSKVALLKTYQCEKFISTKLKEFVSKNVELSFDADEFIERMENKHIDILKNGLSHQQKDFFRNIQKYSVNLLVGFAGTGKTFLQILLIELLEELKLSYALLSPSGKAAKILSKYTKRKAQTIHKAIGYGEGKETRHLVELNHDFIIVDETSMLDVFVGSMLMAKITNPDARILFLGDAYQLQSVSSGCLLHDMIESEMIPTAKLDIVFRQSEGGVLDVATRIRLGEKLVDDNFIGVKKFGNNFILHCVEQAHMEDGYKYYYNKLMKKYEPNDIMVLSPTKKGDLGTFAINAFIQELVNKEEYGKVEYKFGDINTFRQDDYVINTKNVYQIDNIKNDKTDIVNGDTGKVLDIILEGEKEIRLVEDEYGDMKEITYDPRGIVIEFDDDTVKIGFNELIQLLHAWCLTCHKSQGSSSKAVEVIADKAHKFQLSANLLYTAITRTEQDCVLLTQAETLNYAIRKVENLRRQTFLEDMLRSQ